jgi:hypothetical protein
MAEEAVTLESLEAENVSPWVGMNPEDRTKYLDGLHAKLDADKAEDATPVEETPGRARDDAGRFAKNESTDTDAGDETPADVDAVLPDKEDEEVQADWRDAAAKDLATAYGIGDDMLAKIPSREVLDVVLDGIDNKRRSDKETPVDQATTTQQATQDSLPVSDALARLKAFELDDELGADDAPKIRDMVSATAAALEQVIAFQQQQQADIVRQTQAHVGNLVEAEVDKLGYADLFGKPGKRTPEQSARMRAIVVDHFERGEALAARGGKPSPTTEFVKRSVFALHGEDIIKQEQQKHLAKLKNQSSRRTGGGSTNGNLPLRGATPLERALSDLPHVRQELGIGND